jgi:putative iron-only hydrogenase system regulator
MEESGETRIAIVGVIVTDKDSVEELNQILHEYSDYIIGRLGLPYRSRGLNIISVAVDGPTQIINLLAGRLGRLPGVTARAVYSNKEPKA